MGGCCGSGNGHGHGEEQAEEHGHGHGHGHEHGGMPTMQAPVSATVTVTDKAATKLQELLKAEKKGAEFGLRLGVQGGGCSGLSYFMDFDTQREGDRVFEHQGVRVFIDPKSINYVGGSELDFTDGLMGSGFAIKNPNKKGGCGCGNSFST